MPFKHNPGCDCCGVPCDHCDTDTFPANWQVVIASVAANNCAAANCAGWNGTYVLPTQPADQSCSAQLSPAAGNRYSAWDHGVPVFGIDCHDASGTFSLFTNGSGGLFVTLLTSGGPSCDTTYQWSKTDYTASEIPCESISNLSLTQDSPTENCGGKTQDGCDWSSATCTVTAL